RERVSGQQVASKKQNNSRGPLIAAVLTDGRTAGPLLTADGLSRVKKHSLYGGRVVGRARLCSPGECIWLA
ncbi:hypothetical protein BaRGS_00015808, partial [Batillaria attramentaria]